MLGTVICADVITNKLTVKEIKAILQDKLEKYKIPQVINIVENFALTNSGKRVGKYEKNIVLTGDSKGLGLKTRHALESNGYNVIGISRNLKTLNTIFQM